MPVTAEARVQSQTSLFGAFNENTSTETDFSPSISVYPCQYHSTNDSYLFLYKLGHLISGTDRIVTEHIYRNELDFGKRWKMILT